VDTLSAPYSACDAFEAQYVRPAPGRVLIVGARVYGSREDRRIRHAEAVGVDMLAGPGVDAVIDMEEPAALALGTFAHIECVSVLEHSRRPWLLAANLERMLQPGGTIYVTAPFVWRVHGYPHDYWRFTQDGVRELLPGITWDAMAYTHHYLTAKNRVPAFEVEGIPYFARTEVCGFGRLA
jgi:SAM-dependent methyltransferase